MDNKCYNYTHGNEKCLLHSYVYLRVIFVGTNFCTNYPAQNSDVEPIVPEMLQKIRKFPPCEITRSTVSYIHIPYTFQTIWAQISDYGFLIFIGSSPTTHVLRRSSPLLPIHTHPRHSHSHSLTLMKRWSQSVGGGAPTTCL